MADPKAREDVLSFLSINMIQIITKLLVVTLIKKLPLYTQSNL